jgi:DNA-binding FrmR family transcriptional regulator
MSHTTKDKQKLVLRAKRIQGQVEALVRVLTEERDCSEVLQVMSAARGATIVMLASGAILSLTRDGRKRATGRSAVRARYIP